MKTLAETFHECVFLSTNICIYIYIHIYIYIYMYIYIYIYIYIFSKAHSKRCFKISIDAQRKTLLVNVSTCVFISIHHIYIGNKETINWILIVRMKNEREINKKEMFLSTLRPFKLMLSSECD